MEKLRSDLIAAAKKLQEDADSTSPSREVVNLMQYGLPRLLRAMLHDQAKATAQPDLAKVLVWELAKIVVSLTKIFVETENDAKVQGPTIALLESIFQPSAQFYVISENSGKQIVQQQFKKVVTGSKNTPIRGPYILASFIEMFAKNAGFETIKERVRNIETPSSTLASMLSLVIATSSSISMEYGGNLFTALEKGFYETQTSKKTHDDDSEVHVCVANIEELRRLFAPDTAIASEYESFPLEQGMKLIRDESKLLVRLSGIIMIREHVRRNLEGKQPGNYVVQQRSRYSSSTDSSDVKQDIIDFLRKQDLWLAILNVNTSHVQIVKAADLLLNVALQNKLFARQTYHWKAIVKWIVSTDAHDARAVSDIVLRALSDVTARKADITSVIDQLLNKLHQFTKTTLDFCLKLCEQANRDKRFELGLLSRRYEDAVITFVSSEMEILWCVLFPLKQDDSNGENCLDIKVQDYAFAQLANLLDKEPKDIKNAIQLVMRSWVNNVSNTSIAQLTNPQLYVHYSSCLLRFAHVTFDAFSRWNRDRDNDAANSLSNLIKHLFPSGQKETVMSYAVNDLDTITKLIYASAKDGKDSGFLKVNINALKEVSDRLKLYTSCLERCKPLIITAQNFDDLWIIIRDAPMFIKTVLYDWLCDLMLRNSVREVKNAWQDNQKQSVYFESAVFPNMLLLVRKGLALKNDDVLSLSKVLRLAVLSVNHKSKHPEVSEIASVSDFKLHDKSIPEHFMFMRSLWELAVQSKQSSELLKELIDFIVQVYINSGKASKGKRQFVWNSFHEKVLAYIKADTDSGLQFLKSFLDAEKKLDSADEVPMVGNGEATIKLTAFIQDEKTREFKPPQTVSFAGKTTLQELTMQLVNGNLLNFPHEFIVVHLNSNTRNKPQNKLLTLAQVKAMNNRNSFSLYFSVAFYAMKTPHAVSAFLLGAELGDDAQTTLGALMAEHPSSLPAIVDLHNKLVEQDDSKDAQVKQYFDVFESIPMNRTLLQFICNIGDPPPNGWVPSGIFPRYSALHLLVALRVAQAILKKRDHERPHYCDNVRGQYQSRMRARMQDEYGAWSTGWSSLMTAYFFNQSCQLVASHWRRVVSLKALAIAGELLSQHPAQALAAKENDESKLFNDILLRLNQQFFGGLVIGEGAEAEKIPRKQYIESAFKMLLMLLTGTTPGDHCELKFGQQVPPPMAVFPYDRADQILNYSAGQETNLQLFHKLIDASFDCEEEDVRVAFKDGLTRLCCSSNEMLAAHQQQYAHLATPNSYVRLNLVARFLMPILTLKVINAKNRGRHLPAELFELIANILQNIQSTCSGFIQQAPYTTQFYMNDLKSTNIMESNFLFSMMKLIEYHSGEVSESKPDKRFISLFKLCACLLQVRTIFMRGGSEDDKFVKLLANRCLFSGTDAGVMCKSAPARKEVFNVLNALLSDAIPNFVSFCKYLKTLLISESKSKSGKPSKLSTNLDAHKFVGLCNMGNTCYVNSFLQQLYQVPGFAHEFLRLDPSGGSDNEKGEEGTVVYSLQSVFLDLMYSTKPAFTPELFFQKFKGFGGMPLDIREQMDVLEFLNAMFMQFTEAQSENMQRSKALLEDNFCFKIVASTTCDDCKNKSERFESANCLSVDVIRNSIIDSLNDCFQEEKLSGGQSFLCETCNKKVDAHKRAAIQGLPSTMIMHLKRFEFDFKQNRRTKVNSRFDFPLSLDMSPYVHDADGEDCTDYNLVGVLVHSGGAASGHYYSFIKSRGAEQGWFEFNDDKVTPFDLKNADAEWFGGTEVSRVNVGDDKNPQWIDYESEKSRSAYLLLYQKATVDSSQAAEHKSQRKKMPRYLESSFNVLRMARLNETNIALFTNKEFVTLFERYVEFVVKSGLSDEEKVHVRAATDLFLLAVIPRAKVYDSKVQLMINFIRALKVRSTQVTADVFATLSQSTYWLSGLVAMESSKSQQMIFNVLQYYAGDLAKLEQMSESKTAVDMENLSPLGKFCHMVASFVQQSDAQLLYASNPALIAVFMNFLATISQAPAIRGFFTQTGIVNALASMALESKTADMWHKPLWSAVSMIMQDDTRNNGFPMSTQLIAYVMDKYGKSELLLNKLLGSTNIDAHSIVARIFSCAPQLQYHLWNNSVRNIMYHQECEAFGVGLLGLASCASELQSVQGGLTITVMCKDVIYNLMPPQFLRYYRNAVTTIHFLIALAHSSMNGCDRGEFARFLQAENRHISSWETYLRQNPSAPSKKSRGEVQLQKIPGIMTLNYDEVFPRTYGSGQLSVYQALSQMKQRLHDYR